MQTTILKLGGSVITYKNQKRLRIRTKLISAIMKNIRQALDQKPQNLIIIHGAGSIGHQIALKYDLQNGIKKQTEKKQWCGIIETVTRISELRNTILRAAKDHNLHLFPFQTAALVENHNKLLKNYDTRIIESAVTHDVIPLLYGDLVFDDVLKISVCSGDVLAADLTRKIDVKRVIFASDVDGIFTKDPHVHRDALLIPEIKITDIQNNSLNISHSHNKDVTDGLRGKLKPFLDDHFNKKNVDAKNTLQEIIICNGLKPENYKNILLDKKITHTKIVCV